MMSCKICGARAKGNNYGVLSCMSCKVFFQRHGLSHNYANITLKCRFTNGVCTINETTRKLCISCRLTACLQAGMRRKRTNLTDMIRLKYQRARLTSLDLLNADRSSLSMLQWDLISNITHTYDNLFDVIKQKLSRFYNYNEQKPIKLRLKMSNYQQLVAIYFTFIIPFLEHIPEYQSLEESNRLTLIHHNMITLTGINSHYLASTIGFIPYFHKNYAPIMNMIYGSEMISANEKLRQRLDRIFHTDLILIKLTLVIFAFSNVTHDLSSTSLLITKSTNDELRSSNKLFTIQNKYVDILRRYMLFRYRNEQTVIHLFSNIIYNCLHVQTFSYRVSEENDKHRDIYERLSADIESKLNLQDSI